MSDKESGDDEPRERREEEGDSVDDQKSPAPG
jgi:hypothetical protein